MRDKVKIQYENTPIIIPVLKCTEDCTACSKRLCLLI